MSDVSTLLQQSRAAHRQGRTQMEKKQPGAAKELFRSALNLRLKARNLDPGRTDVAWLEDLKNLHAGVRWAQDDPSLVSRFDLDIEHYLRQQLGAEVNLERTAGPDAEVVA